MIYSTSIKGRWGEVQLKRVLELAGMTEYCDFLDQSSVKTEDNKLLRPDIIINLPGRKNVVVDSKVPLSSFLEFMKEDKDEIEYMCLEDLGEFNEP